MGSSLGSGPRGAATRHSSARCIALTWCESDVMLEKSRRPPGRLLPLEVARPLPTTARRTCLSAPAEGAAHAQKEGGRSALLRPLVTHTKSRAAKLGVLLVLHGLEPLTKIGCYEGQPMNVSVSQTPASLSRLTRSAPGRLSSCHSATSAFRRVRAFWSW